MNEQPRLFVDRMMDDHLASRLVSNAQEDPDGVFNCLRVRRIRPTDRFFAFLDQIEPMSVARDGSLRDSYRQFLSSFPDRIISDIILRFGLPETASTFLQELPQPRFDNILLLSLKHSDLGVRDFGDENDPGIPHWHRIIQRLAQLCRDRASQSGLTQGATPERWVIIQNATSILNGGPLAEADLDEQKWLAESLDLEHFDSDLSLLILWRLMTSHPHLSFYLDLLPQLFGGVTMLQGSSSGSLFYQRLRTHSSQETLDELKDLAAPDQRR